MVDISSIFNSADYIPVDDSAFAPDNDDGFISAIDELRTLDQWVGWKIVMRPDKDGVLHPTKPPVNPHNGRGASHSRPEDWSSYAQAEAAVRRYRLAGVGFVLSEDDGYTGVDLDKCRNAKTGQIEPWAQELVNLAETYAEVSPSGTGIRMIVRGKIAATIKCDPAHVEIYRSQRYLTITGDHLDGTPEDIRPAPVTLAALIARAEAIKPKREEPPAADPQPRQSGRAARSGSAPPSTGDSFFRAVNDKALANLESWVTDLFPRARRQPGTGGWRVSSRDLGRRLQEDLSIASTGAVDFGIADMGDAREGKRTAIDLVLEYGGAPDAIEAALWLCDRMGVDPAALGWQDDSETIAIGDKIAEAIIARNAQRETVVVDGVTIDAETGEIIDESPRAQEGESQQGTEEAPPRQSKQQGVELETVNAADLAGKPVPFQRWLVEDLIPEANVTMLSGDGATGKSLLGLQLAVAVATGGDWIGVKPQPGRAVFVSAEDEIDEIHRRLDRMTPRLETLGRLTIVPLAGKDAVLAAPVGRDGLLRPTPLFTALRHIIEKHRPELLVLDTLADLFGGDEIKKVHARQFIAMLRGLALKFDVTVLLLSHPSQAGLNSGSGMSGNTAWSNSVRSRLYFERRVNKFDGSEDDADIRVLTTKKANRAASGGKIVVRYCDGVFVREKGNDLDAKDLNHQAERVFMTLLAQFEREGRMVSDRPSSTFAPAVFAAHPNANGISKGTFQKAMDRLFESGSIKVVEAGPLSRRRRKIALANLPEHDDGEVGEDHGRSDSEREGSSDDAS